MAVLIPDVPKDCPNSERHVYERLGRDLPDTWIVLHSLGLAGHESKIWGEADIVILSERGVFALEVKGGTVDCVDGIWRFSGDFATFTKRESPWAQAMGALAAIRRRLQEARPAFRDVLFGFGVRHAVHDVHGDRGRDHPRDPSRPALVPAVADAVRDVPGKVLERRVRAEAGG